MGSNASKQRKIKEEIQNLNNIAEHLDELMTYLKQKDIQLPTRLLNNGNVDINLLRIMAFQTGFS
jgi:hypothetical protein